MRAMLTLLTLCVASSLACEEAPHRYEIAHLAGNALGNSLESSQKMAKVTSAIYGGDQVFQVHIASNGFSVDAFSAGFEKLGANTGATLATDGALRASIQEAKGPGDSHFVTADFDSRSVSSFQRCLEKLDPCEQKMLWIATYGDDPLLDSRSVTRVARYNIKDDRIQFTQVRNTWSRAPLSSKTYQEALKDSADKLNQFLGETYTETHSKIGFMALRKPRDQAIKIDPIL